MITKFKYIKSKIAKEKSGIQVKFSFVGLEGIWLIAPLQEQEQFY